MSNKPKEILELEAKIRSSKYDHYKVVALLILEKTPEELERIRQAVSPTFKGLLSLSYLRRSSIEQVFGRGYNVEKDIVDLYGLFLYLFRYHASYINKYVELRNKVYDFVLLGEYKKAEALIKDIDTISRSMWAERMKLTILKLKGDEDAYTKYYNGIIDLDIQGKLRFLLRNTNNSLNFNPYDNDINEKNVKGVIESGVQNNNLRLFYESYCCPFLDLTSETWVSMSLNTSIIDLYECILVNLRHLSDDTIANVKFRLYISQINQLITDNMLQRWCYLEDISRQDDVLDKENVCLQQYYYGCNYEKLWEKGFAYIKSHPRDVNMYLLLAKSVAYCQMSENIDYGFDNKTLAGQILLSIIAMLTNKNDKINGTNAVLGACYSLNFILELRSLYIFAHNYQNVFLDKLHNSCWGYSPTLSLYDSAKYQGKDKQEYVTLWQHHCDIPDGVLDAYMRSLNTPEMYPLLISDDNIDPDSLMSLLDQNDLPAYLQSGLASFIYNRLLMDDNPDQALAFFVDKTISDKAIEVRKRDDVPDTISDNYELLEQYPLEMSIFRTMTDMPDYERFDAYLCYLEKMGVLLASELDVDKDNSKQMYFLSDVCDLSVLWQHVDVLKSSNYVYEERLKICKKLLEVIQSKRISREISDIIQQQKIKTLTRKVDESKIYVDVSAIQKKELDTVRTYFDLFLNVDALSDDPDEIATDDNEMQLHVTPDEMEKMRRTLFIRIFYGVRDKFLFDPKFGLEFFLSTRIRHGTLMNQLRHSFEAYDLVTRKDSDETYTPDYYWSEVKFRLAYNGRKQLKTFIDAFTKSIDNNILTVKDEYVQIQTELKPEKTQGVFNFCEDKISDVINEAYNELSGVQSFTDMVSVIIDKLWQHTSECLINAKHKLDTFAAECTHSLDKLDQDVCNMFPNHYNSEFHNVIVDCKTLFIRDVEIVKDWFQRTHTADFDFRIKDVFDTSLNFINNVHQIPLFVEESINSTTVFCQRSHFIALYDMFSDMFNNVCNYAVERFNQDNDLDAQIIIDESDNYLNIEFSNCVDEEDENNILKTIEERKANASKLMEQGVSHSDKKTGIVRMMILTKNAFGDSNNEFDVNLVNHRFVVSVKINKLPLMA